MAFAPYLMAASTLMQGVSANNTARVNAGLMGQEQNLAVNQGAQQEALVRRSSAEALGRQEAAFGGAGVGYGGSSGTALKSSAINQELDALNTRYRASVTGFGYGAQAKILQYEGQQSLEGAGLLAGGQALSAMSKRYYTPTVAATSDSLGP
jgi:hypothetical protein